MTCRELRDEGIPLSSKIMIRQMMVYPISAVESRKHAQHEGKDARCEQRYSTRGKTLVTSLRGRGLGKTEVTTNPRQQREKQEKKPRVSGRPPTRQHNETRQRYTLDWGGLQDAVESRDTQLSLQCIWGTKHPHGH